MDGYRRYIIYHLNKKNTPNYMIHDSLGLYVVVMRGGNEFWRFRYKFNGKNNQFSIGPHIKKGKTYITLDEARKQRDECRECLKKGIDPMDFRVKNFFNCKRRNNVKDAR